MQTSCRQENAAQLSEAGAAKLLQVGALKLELNTLVLAVGAGTEEDHTSDTVKAAAEYSVMWWGHR